MVSVVDPSSMVVFSEVMLNLHVVVFLVFSQLSSDLCFVINHLFFYLGIDSVLDEHGKIFFLSLLDLPLKEVSLLLQVSIISVGDVLVIVLISKTQSSDLSFFLVDNISFVGWFLDCSHLLSEYWALR